MKLKPTEGRDNKLFEITEIFFMHLVHVLNVRRYEIRRILNKVFTN